MGQFELALHPDKTRLICFGRLAASNGRSLERGSPKPSRISARGPAFAIGGKTIKKRMRAKLLALIELRWTMHDPITKTGAWIKRMKVTRL
jgi:RNA-directed DNA polymerase